LLWLRREKPLQPAAALDERRIQKKFAVDIKKIEEHELHGDFLDEPEIRIPAAEAFLKLREWQRLRIVPGEDLAIQDVLARQSGQGFAQFGEFDNLVKRA